MLKGGDFQDKFDLWTSSDSAATDARLIAPCCLLVGSAFFPKDKHDASKALDKAQRVYSEIKDELELTTCDIKRGDWLVTSAGPPEVWNSLLKEGIEGMLCLLIYKARNFVSTLTTPTQPESITKKL